ncbi:putative cytochrome biosynthesis protein [Candidatus Methanoperedens nitroreducens]|uniref:Putative cytochrome biosynthesis protein n=1 Tax=Candidatus Methanoperedens nitratireducens TaxID=1392998 RepID=A0A062V767_9EURY|nr:cytochrome c-type biogenesis protein CcmH [Candidatus Methanoperedens nitroreducens]KCZ72398.1 putative cytochrome biosynthesis protein [Candidatus Methanoperedens nitroreducens]MDJ1423668.1 cytochrome c-type biogenesis protein CcmH [Candidatus Methanoperedens sp.]
MIYKIIAILFFMTVLAMPVIAVTEEEITSNLNCPDVGGCTMIAADCSCESALELKGKVRAMLDQGLSQKQIYDRLTAEYGREILATPPKEGFDWIVWLALPAGIIVGGVVVYKISRKKMDEDEIFEYEYQKFLQEREK